MNKRFTVVIYNTDGTHKEVYQTQQLKRAFYKALEVNSDQKAVIYELHKHIKWHGREADYEGTYMDVRLTFGNNDIQTLKEWYLH